MRRKSIIILCALALWAASGCSIHEIPEGGDGNAAVTLSLDVYLDGNLAPGNTFKYATKASGKSARYIIRFYPKLGERIASDFAHEFVLTEKELTDQTFRLPVVPMDYHIEAWADWMYNDEAFYDTSDFSAVTVYTDPYTGAVEMRDAYCGWRDLDLSGYHANSSIATSSITLHRPLTRLQFLSTDKDDFIRYWASQVAILDGTNVKDPDSIDLSKFRVVVTYPQYMPVSYNIREGSVSDSATGVSFETTMQELEDGTVLLAWDWVFASGDDPSVVVTISVFDEEGRPVISLDNLQIPLTPGTSTIVIGKLLSSQISGGILVDPSFDGEYTIHI